MFGPLRAAGVFMLAIPLGRAPISDHDLGRAAPWFPVVGFGLGLLLVATAALLDPWMAHGPRAVAVVMAWGLLTGGLHLDGVADSFDGLGGWRGNRARMLEIMRDSTIGAHGAAALVLLLVGKVVAVTTLLHQDATIALLVAPIVARGVLVPLIAWIPYARPEGTGRRLKDGTRRGDGWTGLLCAGAALALCGPGTAAVAFGTGVVVVAFASAMRKRLGGLTGDTYGASVELCELAVLCLMTA